MITAFKFLSCISHNLLKEEVTGSNPVEALIPRLNLSTLDNSLAPQVIEYAVQVWNPHLTQDVVLLEKT